MNKVVAAQDQKLGQKPVVRRVQISLVVICLLFLIGIMANLLWPKPEPKQMGHTMLKGENLSQIIGDSETINVVKKDMRLVVAKPGDVVYYKRDDRGKVVPGSAGIISAKCAGGDPACGTPLPGSFYKE